MPKIKINWKEVRAQALSRGSTECPICLTELDMRLVSLSARKKLPSIQRQRKSENKKSMVLLSCSHVFHDRCIQSFEEFTEEDVKSNPSCPVCRSTYERKEFSEIVI